MDGRKDGGMEGKKERGPKVPMLHSRMCFQ